MGFKFNHPTVKIEFDDGPLSYELALNEATRIKMANAAEKLKNIKSAELDGVDEILDFVLDGVDDMLGEGAADDIMALCPDYGYVEAMQVWQYITATFIQAYNERLHNMAQLTVQPNRAERRKRNK